MIEHMDFILPHQWKTHFKAAFDLIYYCVGFFAPQLSDLSSMPAGHTAGSQLRCHYSVLVCTRVWESEML